MDSYSPYSPYSIDSIQLDKVRTVMGKIFKVGLVQFSVEMRAQFTRKKYSKLMLEFFVVVIF